MSDARLLVRALADPGSVVGFDDARWTRLLAVARAEALIGSLAGRLRDAPIPAGPARILEDARGDSDRRRVQALWEAEMARRALSDAGLPLILLKGSAYAAAGLAAAEGRSIGDLDILVPRDRLDDAERCLIAAGWEWVKEDSYDDLYYRRWMHELPPLIHKARDRMIDVHHTILPPTARPRPDAAALIADSVEVTAGVRVLSPEDMIVHAAAHLFADGDMAGGLRNLWDIDRLIRQFARGDFMARLERRAEHHQLGPAVGRALRLAGRVYGTPGMPAATLADRLFEARLLARNGWGQETRRALRLGFYIRSHWLRMPPLMLARHLWIKAQRS